jgi:DnaK suppressor protein
MTTRERAVRLRNMFESYRGRLLGEIADKLREARDEPHDEFLGDMLDRGERFHEQDLQYTLLGMKTETIQRIDEALDRLAEGEYGLCSECGQEISEQRLSAMPFAVRCCDCEELAEESHHSHTPRRGSRVLFDEANV